MCGHFCLVAVGSLLSLGLVGKNARAGDGNAPELVRGIIARSEAVFSGRLRYFMKTGFVQSQKLLNDAECFFSFSGADWSLHYIGMGRTEASLNGKYLEFLEFAQPSGKTVRNLNLWPARAMEIDYPCPPFFGGTLWYKDQRKWLKEHASAGILQDKREVVNGIKTRLMDWHVSKADAGEAFHGYNNLTEGGGTLRLYVAPQLGFVLARVECIGKAGASSTRFDASNFLEAPCGVFFPRNLTEQNYDEKGPNYFVRYKILDIEKLNQTVPEANFQFTVPDGTVIIDNRSLTHSESFRVGEVNSKPLPDLSDVIANLPPPGRPFLTGGNALIIGLGFGGFVLSVYLLWSRFRHAKH